MLREDNNGFINFPPLNLFTKKPGKTYVYIVSFDIDTKYELMNNRLVPPSNYITDDIFGVFVNINDKNSYLPNILDDKGSLNLITSICVGWNDNVFSFRNSHNPDGEKWYATFRDLTNEGRKLFYSIKKLHNNKEVRILTIVG